MRRSYVSRYTGYDDGRLRADIAVQTVSDAVLPTDMYYATLPGAFLEWCPAEVNSPCIFETTSVIGQTFDANRNVMDAIARGVFLPKGTPPRGWQGGNTLDDPFVYWLGLRSGEYGLFTVPRSAEVNGEPTSIRGQIDNNAFPERNLSDSVDPTTTGRRASDVYRHS